MSTDIREQIRELAEFHRLHRQPVEIHEVHGEAGRTKNSVARPRLGGPALALAVMAAVLVVVGGLALLVSTSEETPPADTVVPPTVVVPTTVPTTPSTSIAGETPIGTPGLAWERIAQREMPDELGVGPLNSKLLDGGDRFILLQGAEALTAGASSFDGVTWETRRFEGAVGDTVMGAAWEDMVLVASGGGGWSREEDGGPVFSIPSVVSVIRPDGSVERRVFDGDVQSMAIGPVGMLVTLAPHASYGYVIDQILGSEFSGTLYQASLQGGVLVVERALDGETAEIVLSEHGLTEDDLNSPVAGWYSESGSAWVPVPDMPPGLSPVGTRDGFVGVSGSMVWHSEDGLEWNLLGDLPFAPDPWRFSQTPTRWQEGVVATDLSQYAYISADGIELLPDPPLIPSSADQAPLPHLLSGRIGHRRRQPGRKGIAPNPRRGDLGGRDTAR